MRSFKLLFVAALVAGTAFLGCRVQSEGERCEVANGNLDCADGLNCTGNICCPPVGQETTDDCRNAHKGPAATPDAGGDGVAAETSPDGATDSPTDSPADTATTDGATDAGDSSSDTGTTDATDAATDTPAG